MITLNDHPLQTYSLVLTEVKDIYYEDYILTKNITSEPFNGVTKTKDYLKN